MPYLPAMICSLWTICMYPLLLQIDEQIEQLFASKKRVTDVAKANMPQVAAGKSTLHTSVIYRSYEGPIISIT